MAKILYFIQSSKLVPCSIDQDSCKNHLIEEFNFSPDTTASRPNYMTTNMGGTKLISLEEARLRLHNRVNSQQAAEDAGTLFFFTVLFTDYAGYTNCSFFREVYGIILCLALSNHF